MKAIISAAGTGGHIYPALSVISKIKEKNKNAEILYIGTTDRMEKDIIPSMNIKYEGIEIYGFNKSIKHNIKALKCMFTATKKVKEILTSFKPDVVIGFGGYVTVPIIKEAKKLGIKTIIHEQNSIPGKANKYISKYADKICLSMEDKTNSFDKEKCVFTGNPRGEEVLTKPRVSKKSFGLSVSKKLVLITNGSLGSKTVNEKIVTCFPLMANKNYEVLFVTGRGTYDLYKDLKVSKNIKIVPYLDNMASVLKNTDLIISRAGATILAEITALGIPSVLIPSPYVPNNHQYYNAKALEDENASIIIEEKDLTTEKVIDVIDLILDDKEKYNLMQKNAKKLGVIDSQERIYKVIESLLK